MSLFRLPGPMEDVGLDWTWQAALVYFADHRFQFGRDVLYTYGPLGFLQVAVTPGIFFLPMFLGRAIVASVGATALAMLTWRSKSFLVVTAVTFVAFLFSQYDLDALPLTTNTILACLCLAVDAPIAILVFSASIIASISLIKFTYLTDSVFCISVIFAHFLIKRQNKRAIWSAVSFVFSFILIWLFFSHQGIGSLPSFVRGSAEIANGFNANMFTKAQGEILPYAISQATLLVLLTLLLFVALPFTTAIARVAIIFAAIFITWKQGIVRADWGHSIVLPLSAQIISILVFVQILQVRSAAGRLKFVAFSGVTISILLSCGFLRELSIVGEQPTLFSFSRAQAGVNANMMFLFNYSGYNAYLSRKVELAQEKFRLPKITSDIEGKSVDVFGDESGIAILNKWNYHPRPIFQSFSAYTKYLLDRNQRFIAGDNPPDYYVVKLQAIDERSSTDADSAAFKAILALYEPIDAEKGYLLFRKLRKDRATSLEPIVASVDAGVTTFNKEILLDPALEKGAMIDLVLDIKPSLLGVARSFIFKPPLVTLRVKTTSRGVSEFRLLPSIAPYGTPIWPQLWDDIDLHSMLSGREPDSVSSFEIRVADEDKAFFKPDFSYSFKETLKIPVAPGINYMKDLLEFGTVPEAIDTPFHARMMNVDGRNVLFVHAPSTVTLKVPPSATKVHGVFGVLPGAFSHTQGTQFVEFTISTAGALASQILQQDIAVSEMRPFDVALPREHADRVEFKIDCRPGCEGGWSYWGGLSFDAAPDASAPSP